MIFGNVAHKGTNANMSKTWVHKNACHLVDNCPIFKIQSVLERRPQAPRNSIAYQSFFDSLSCENCDAMRIGIWVLNLH